MDINTGEYIEKWLANKSYRTQVSYRRHLERYLSFILTEGSRLETVTKETLGKYKSHLLKVYSVSSVANIFSTISSFYDFIELGGVIRNNPIKALNREDLKVVPYSGIRRLSFRDFKSIIDSINQDLLSGLRDRAILLLMFYTGMKASQIVILKFKDLLEINGDDFVVINNNGIDLKSFIDPFVVHAIEDYLSQDMRDEWLPEDLIFQRSKENGDALIAYHGRKASSEGLTTRALEGNLKTYAKRAGLEGVTLNSIRQVSAVCNQMRFGKDEDQMRFFLNHSTTRSVRRFLRQAQDTKPSLFE